MKILVLYANPVETSFGAALHDATLKALRASGHTVDDCDLYEESFDPVLSREDRLAYDHSPLNRRRVESYVERLLAAEGLIVISPVWNIGFPAILKGYFDRVFLPGVTFEVAPDGRVTTKLHNIRMIGAVATYGGSRIAAMLIGDAPRHFITRSLKAVCRPGASCDYLALYGMNAKAASDRANFLSRVSDRFAAW